MKKIQFDVSVHCKYSQWGEWSNTCGPVIRNRSVLNHGDHGGKECDEDLFMFFDKAPCQSKYFFVETFKVYQLYRKCVTRLNPKKK